MTVVSAEDRAYYDKLSDRPCWQDIFMNMAEQVAQRSTCLRLKTGALLIRDQRVVSLGFNGTTPGSEHCCDYWFRKWKEDQEKTTDAEKKMSFETFMKTTFSEQHHEWSTVNEIHGEENCILYAARQGISTENTEMYSLYSPCIYCAKTLKTAMVKKVYYKEDYKRDQRGVEFLRAHGVECVQWPPEKKGEEGAVAAAPK